MVKDELRRMQDRMKEQAKQIQVLMSSKGEVLSGTAVGGGVEDAKNVETVFQKVQKTISDREVRAVILLVKGLPESDASEANERREDDI